MKNNIALIVFFNADNMEDYAIANVETRFLKEIGEFPKEQLSKLIDFIKDLDFNKHDQLTHPKIKEYDLVELLVEGENYTKFGVHKGDRGCVISNYSIQAMLKLILPG